MQDANGNTVANETTATAQALLAPLRKFRGRLPADLTFDRLEANERDDRLSTIDCQASTSSYPT